MTGGSGEMVRIFRKTGRSLLVQGLNTSHSGNLSMREGEKILITRTGAMLGDLRSVDIVEIPIDSEGDPRASLEYPVHRRIYLRTAAKAVVHCHPPCAVSLSLSRDEIVPVDLEGRHHLDRVPVLGDTVPSADEIASVFDNGGKVLVVRGHGAFSAGDTMEDALHYVSALEMSAKVIILSSITGTNR